MAHLLVQGIEVPCSASTSETVRLGEITRSLNGMPRTSARVRKREYRFTTDQGGLLMDLAEVVRQLIEGEGHSWGFEGSELYSSRHLLPSAITDMGITSGDAAGKHGLGLFAPEGSAITWPVAVPTTSYTVMFWRLEDETFNHYLLRKSGSDPLEVWANEDGPAATNPSIIAINGSGSLVFTADEGQDETVDDLVVLPYAVPEEWILTLFDYRQAYQWSPLPYVQAKGPGVPGTSLLAGDNTTLDVLGQCGEGMRVPMTEEDGNFTTGEVFSFTLHGT
jgi:hypothetical protein